MEWIIVRIDMSHLCLHFVAVMLLLQ
jgi:hypothetical protein